MGLVFIRSDGINFTTEIMDGLRYTIYVTCAPLSSSSIRLPDLHEREFCCLNNLSVNVYSDKHAFVAGKSDDITVHTQTIYEPKGHDRNRIHSGNFIQSFKTALYRAMGIPFMDSYGNYIYG